MSSKSSLKLLEWVQETSEMGKVETINLKVIKIKVWRVGNENKESPFLKCDMIVRCPSHLLLQE